MASIEGSNSDSKNSKRSVLTGESALTLSVRGVPGKQFDVLCKEVLMSEGEETIGSILRKIIDEYTKEILRDSELRKEMGRLVVLLEIYGQLDNQDYAE